LKKKDDLKVKQSYGEAYLPDELYDTDDDEQTDTGCDRRDDCGPCVVYNGYRQGNDKQTESKRLHE